MTGGALPLGVAAGSAAAYVALGLAAAARLGLGRHAAHRLLGAAGVGGDLAPGSRTWVAVQLLRHVALALMAAAIAARGGWPRGVVEAAGIGAAVVLGARLAEALVARAFPERVLRLASPLLRAVDKSLGLLVAPVVRLGELAAARRRGETGVEEEERREEQIEEYIRDAEEEGLLEREQSELLREIVDVGDQVVREVMTPRTEIKAVPADADIDALRRALVASRHSRLPVYEGNLDKIVGIVSLREVLPHLVAPRPDVRARDLMHPVRLVPASKPVLELLRELQRERQQMAVVVDEYGGTAGIVTIEDLVEEIVGEIRDEHEPAREPLQPQPGGEWLVDGRMPIDELERRLGVELPEDEVDTIGGLLFSRLGRVPRLGDRAKLAGGIELEVARLDGRRVAAVRLRPAAEGTGK
ncbi:MAG: HlyC/CorC family transporter [Acidobacteria bacterium]|nr:MAG: HlyC/CorC family transporter [Acidobacteriota bacterium]